MSEDITRILGSVVVLSSWFCSGYWDPSWFFSSDCCTEFGEYFFLIVLPVYNIASLLGSLGEFDASK